MRSILQIILALALNILIISCSKTKQEAPVPVNSAITVDITATHAIELAYPIKALTFLSNDTAPWLGQVIVLTEKGKLYSTGIEGNVVKAIGSRKYKDIFGLSRKNSAGVFLAITDNNTLEAFIESDDNGNFSAMTISGNAKNLTRFCTTSKPKSNSIKALTSNGSSITELHFDITKLVIEQSELQEILLEAPIRGCSYDDDSYTPNANVFSINGEPFSLSTDKKHIVLNNAEAQDGEVYNLSIENGFSIQGLKSASFITLTTENFGGTAFKDGLVAMVDADRPKRIVFISLDYLNRTITELHAP
ncbi:MAG: hypothetical protein V3U57_05690 [Robiginitomaculum sp.]